MSAALNFGIIGRCGCGAIGARRWQHAGEPICGHCLKDRRGYLRTIDQEQALVVGTLSPLQRRARIAWLKAALARETQLVEQREADKRVLMADAA